MIRARWSGALAALAVSLIVLLAGLVGVPRAFADSPGAGGDGPPPGATLKVGIKPLDPFVTRDGDQYRGFSIDLWNEIARRNSWRTTFVWHDTLPPLLADVRDSAVDAGIAGITITKDREQVLDFSYPMFNAGLEVMTTPLGSSSWTGELTTVLIAGVGRYLLALLVALAVAGHVVWLATRRRSGLGYLPGVGMGIYRAAGLGLVGDYGVAEPVRPWGRAAAVVWTITGISFVSLFTAALASQLTAQHIQSSVTSVHDLAGAKVATVGGTSAAAYLTAHEIGFTAVASIDEAYRRLDDGEVGAVVFDSPVLQHRIKATGTTREILVGGIFAQENYGIALPTASPLRKRINETLLDMVADGTYDDLVTRYFGDATSG